MLGRFRSVFALCLLLICAVLLASCGGSDSSGDTTASSEETASGGGEGGSKPTGEPIKVGVIGGITGPSAGVLGGVDDLAKVWETAVNDEGGINGAPVELIVKDSASDPSKATVAARELADEGVIALAGLWDNTAAAYFPYLEQQGIPVVGGETVDPTLEASPIFFPAGGSFPGPQYGIIQSAAEAGDSKMALIYCAEFPGCIALGKGLGNIAELQGEVEVNPRLAVSESAPNYTAQCLEAEQSGADSAYILATDTVLSRVLTDCAKQGIELGQFNFGNNLSRENLSNLDTEGMVLTYRNMPASDTSTPGGAYLNEMLEKYDPDLKGGPEWSEASGLQWAGLQMFRKAAELGNVTAGSTSEDLEAGLYQIKDETLEGIAPPLTFVKGKSKAANCWFTGEVKDEAVEATSNEPACIPEDIADEVAAALGL